MAARQGKRSSRYSVKTIWGAASDPKVALGKEELYSLIYRETGKEHMSELTQAQIEKVCTVLFEMKDNAVNDKNRIDVGGNPQTVKMRRKIYMLAQELGWNNERINAFSYKMNKVDSIKWITLRQCSDIIEALKDMVKREGRDKETEG